MNYLQKMIMLPALLLSAGNIQAQAPKKLEITPLGGDFYVYTTYGTLDDGSRFPSNSLYVVTTKGVVMIDVPWDTTQTLPLLEQIEKRHHKKVIASISTHFHADRTAGLDLLKSKGVNTYSTKHTWELCRDNKEPMATYQMTSDTTFNMGKHKIQVFYPGSGHSADNIVVWFPEDKVLYGGCFVKSVESENLGNLADADVAAWPASVRKVQQTFPNPRFIIPGHGSFKSTKSLERTLQLLKEYKKP
jgi:metallo-beta-lactamase class B